MGNSGVYERYVWANSVIILFHEYHFRSKWELETYVSMIYMYMYS